MAAQSPHLHPIEHQQDVLKWENQSENVYLKNLHGLCDALCQHGPESPKSFAIQSIKEAFL